jgi:hypothetical protein
MAEDRLGADQDPLRLATVTATTIVILMLPIAGLLHLR